MKSISVYSDRESARGVFDLMRKAQVASAAFQYRPQQIGVLDYLSNNLIISRS